VNALDREISSLRVPVSVRVVSSTSGLSAIRDAGCAAVILTRQPEPQLQSWLNALQPDKLPQARVIVRPDLVKEVVNEICDTCGTPLTQERRSLVDDIADMASYFSDLMNVRYLRLRLDVVTTNACRRFHIDAVTARLVCTYRGQTTQLGEAETACDPDEVVSVPQICPVVLRGSNWPGDEPTKLRHRSPPIEGSGETRLLLVLDPIYDLEEDA
jgi:hypothetical protein